MSDWRSTCGSKLTTARAAMRHLRPGQSLYLSAGSAAPQGLYDGLVDPAVALGDNQIIHLLTLGDAPYVRPELAQRFRHNALFIGPNVRQAVSEGRADYTPAFLSEIPGLIRSGRIAIDAALLCVSPPDAEGWCSFGTHVDLAPAVIEVAPALIGEINAQMPRSCGPHRVHVDRFAALVETDRPLPELSPPPGRPETEAIARFIAELVPEGATLQLGIGGIPDGVMRHLRERRDLGLHTEMFSDGVVELAEQGAFGGSGKTLHPGKMIASFVLGSARAYRFLHENPQVELRAVDYTNDPLVIARNERMVAINTCLEIDLTGQVCSDSIGSRFYSGIGGQVDFIRGAARSRGGRPIIALPSTARGGVVSRIVPRLGAGAGVVTTRGDVHWVVTEYGAVNLHGLTVRERAMALISVAHPKFRPWLLAEAKRLNFIYADQLEPPVQVPVYPRQLETRAATRDGTPLLIRPVRPTDESLLRDLFYRLSRETVYHRFFGAKKFMPHASLQHFCTIDYDRDMTLVASVGSGDAERIIGFGTYNVDERSGLADTAYLVDDAWQKRGIGTLLLRRLTEIAEARGVRGFSATVMRGNPAMLRVFAKCGYPVETRDHGDVVELRISFEMPRDAWSSGAQPGDSHTSPS